MSHLKPGTAIIIVEHPILGPTPRAILVENIQFNWTRNLGLADTMEVSGEIITSRDWDEDVPDVREVREIEAFKPEIASGVSR